jgi:hypothetical protein
MIMLWLPSRIKPQTTGGYQLPVTLGQGPVLGFTHASIRVVCPITFQTGPQRVLHHVEGKGFVDAVGAACSWGMCSRGKTQP